MEFELKWNKILNKNAWVLVRTERLKRMSTQSVLFSFFFLKKLINDSNFTESLFEKSFIKMIVYALSTSVLYVLTHTNTHTHMFALTLNRLVSVVVSHFHTRILLSEIIARIIFIEAYFSSYYFMLSRATRNIRRVLCVTRIAFWFIRILYVYCTMAAQLPHRKWDSARSKFRGSKRTFSLKHTQIHVCCSDFPIENKMFDLNKIKTQT